MKRRKRDALNRWIEKITDRAEDLLALITFDGSSWKDRKRNRSSGL